MMKKKYYQVIFYLAIVIFSFLSFSCSKCHNKTYSTLYFSTEDLKIIPYSGYEELMYTDSLENAIIFKGEGKNKRIFKTGYYDFYGCMNTVNSEQSNCFFNYDSNHIEIRIGFAGTTYETYMRYIYFNVILSPVYKVNAFSHSYNFNNDSILPGSNITYKDTLQLGAERFSSVYILFAKAAFIQEEKIDLLYYTIDEGIIAFKTNREHLWIVKN